MRYQSLTGPKKGNGVRLEPKNLTEEEWNEVTQHKTLQYAVLEQIRDNCERLGDLKHKLKDEVKPLEQDCIKMHSMVHSNFTARKIEPGGGVSRPPPVDPFAGRKLDPLNPAKWKSSEGQDIRREKNKRNMQMKQDLMITLETICENKQVNDFKYLVSQTSKAQRKLSPR